MGSNQLRRTISHSPRCGVLLQKLAEHLDTSKAGVAEYGVELLAELLGVEASDEEVDKHIEELKARSRARPAKGYSGWHPGAPTRSIRDLMAKLPKMNEYQRLKHTRAIREAFSPRFTG